MTIVFLNRFKDWLNCLAFFAFPLLFILAVSTPTFANNAAGKDNSLEGQIRSSAELSKASYPKGLSDEEGNALIGEFSRPSPPIKSVSVTSHLDGNESPIGCEAAERVQPGLVRIEVVKRAPKHSSAPDEIKTEGLGFLVFYRNDYYVITCFHVVGGGRTAEDVALIMTDGTRLKPLWTSTRTGKSNEIKGERFDVAVLKVAASDIAKCRGVKPVAMTNSDRISEEDVALYNIPAQKENLIPAQGNILTRNFPCFYANRYFEMIELGISVELGCSGGPAFDASGHVFGMVHSRGTEGSGAAKSYVLPINLVLRIAKELIDNELMAS